MALLMASLPGCISDDSSAEEATPVVMVTSPTLPDVDIDDLTSDAVLSLEVRLKHIYETVNPSVVNIRVVEKHELGGFAFPDLPESPFFEFEIPQQPREYYSEGQGSGFVWDREGHIVTNDHVVSGADRITVTFADGTIVDGEVVGTDPNSDLAVVKVDVDEALLHPVQVGDSTQVQIGQLAVSIGNPFGFDGTMTVGFVSAVGRLLPVGSEIAGAGRYSIPDVIQTDAPINPGNSGGVLVDKDGRLIGVPSAIISPIRASAGIGLAIPAAIVAKVVPALIEDGHYEHPWLGISGTSLTPDLAEAMDLPVDQRGALVVDVLSDSPADEAGLRGSDRQVTIDGVDLRVGGDVIIAMDDEPIRSMDDVVAYLARATEVGQKVELTIIRDGKEKKVEVELAARPGSGSVSESGEDQESGDAAWLGILGMSLTAEIAEAMDLPSEQQGALVVQVFAGSPADEAGLKGSYKPLTIDGEEVLVGGDVIVGLDGVEIDGMPALKKVVGEREPGDEVMLTVLRDGETIDIRVELGRGP